MALVACSALSTLSVPGQGLVDFRRDRHLVGPVSLYLLALADSGERKTTCDAIFGAALRHSESDRRQALSRPRSENPKPRSLPMRPGSPGSLMRSNSSDAAKKLPAARKRPSKRL